MRDLDTAMQIAATIRANLSRWRKVFGPAVYAGDDAVIERQRLALWCHGWQRLDPAHIGPDRTRAPKDFPWPA